MLTKLTKCWRKSKREKGIVLALTCLAASCLIGMAALAVDISHFYLVGAELQNAADAAALAGATELDGYASGITKAVDQAVSILNATEFGGAAVVIKRANIRFAVNLSEFANQGLGRSETEAKLTPMNVRFVKVVNTPQSVNTVFAGMFLGANAIQMTRTAVAGQTVSGWGGDIGLNCICNFVPLAVIQDDVSGAPLGANPECPNQTEFTAGCTYTIRGGSSDKVSPGNAQVLAITGENGAADAKIRMAGGVSQCYRPGSYIGTEPGQNTGPILKGLNTRFGDYKQGLDATLYPPDKNIKEGITYAQYRSEMSQYSLMPSDYEGVPNRRIIILPIINASEFSGGRTSVRITKFAPFFLRNKVEGSEEIVAEFVDRPVVMGRAYYSPADAIAGFSGGMMISNVVLYQ